MSRLTNAFGAAAFSLALFGLGRFIFNLLGVRVLGPTILGELNVGLSAASLAAVLVATVPSVVVARYVAQQAAKNASRAARILGAGLAITWTLGVVGLVIAGIAAPVWIRGPWPWFGFAYATYLVLRSAYFAYQESAEIFASELAAFAVFASVFAAGMLTRNPSLCAISLVLQPGAYSARALWTLRNRISFSGAYEEITASVREYGGFSLATLGNAGASFASYHLTIVLAAKVLPTPADVGYLSVLLALMSPINLVPQALGPVLFSEFSRRQGARDVVGQRHIALRATVLLQLFVLAAVGLAAAFARECLGLAHLPPTKELVVLWSWLTYAAGLTIVSAPSGHLLNATSHASRQALASMAYAGLGLAVGGVGMPRFGVVAAGWMRFAVDGCLAWTRMAIAEWLLKVAGRRWIDLVGFQGLFAALLCLGLNGYDRAPKLAVAGLGAITLAILARQELRQLRRAILPIPIGNSVPPCRVIVARSV